MGGGGGQLPVPVLVARTKMFNANEHNGMFGGTETEIKITIASWGIANLMGLTLANLRIIKNGKWSGTNRDY